MDFNKIKKLIEKYDSIIIYHHVQPDGDALGSTFGLKEIIKDNYPDKKVYVVGGPSGHFDSFFPKVDEPSLEEYENSLVLTLDTPTTERIDGEHYEKAPYMFKIDHHILVESYANDEWVDTSFSSTCEMIVTLAINLNYKISEKSATFLYLGLITDAGRFLYCHSANLFECAKKLVECNADVKKIYPFIYESDISSTRFHGYCQEAFKMTSYGVGYNKLTNDILEKYSIPPFKGSGMVNALSDMRDVDIWAHFSELPEGTIRGELRSKGLPVNEVANKYGGGGHKQAAGCTLMNWDEVDNCLKDLDELIYNSKPYHEELTNALKIAKSAAKLALSVYNSKDFDTKIKEDESPVTKADLEIDEYIRTSLHNIYPEHGLLSEESKDDLSRLDKDYVWIIDPIDGTKDFVAKDDEFAINIALSYKNEIVLGVIAVPAKNIIYYAVKGGGAFKEENNVISRIHTSNRSEGLIGCRSRFHQVIEENKFYNQYENLITDVFEIGSAYKFGLIAEGKLDINLKLSDKTKEWDIAPGTIIVSEAGGSFTKPNGELYSFNKKDYVNREGFIVLNKLNKGFLK